jgi:enamine deaminase RidA (YjgF/YER057c/UK114 family)
MGELEDSWQSVAGEFRTLGYAFRDHYRATKDDADTGPSEDDVRDALHTVTNAVDTALTSVGKAIRDPNVQKSAKDAATSFVEALGDTFTQLGETLDRTFRERRPTKVNVEVEETEPQATEESSESEEPEA